MAEKKIKKKKDGTVSKQGEGGGAPTKFDPVFIDKIIEYFSIEPYTKEIIEQSEEFYSNGEIKKKNVKFRYVPSKMPTLFSFAREIGVAYSTVWRWAERGEDEPETEEALLKKGKTEEDISALIEKQQNLKRFCNSYKEAKELQKEFLISLGLSGASPSPAFIFTAKNITDMRDKQETDLTTGGGFPIQNIDVSKMSEEQIDEYLRTKLTPRAQRKE